MERVINKYSILLESSIAIIEIRTDELQDESVPAPILADIPWIVAPDGTFVV